jgi:heme-degrading monooxygenase HmoA
MSPVTLINAFEVPPGQEEEFKRGWRQIAERLRRAPGFRSTRLHESLDPQARFRYINVAEWESPQHFQEAMRGLSPQLRAHMPFTAYPALYEVVAE